MTQPKVTITELDGQLGVLPPSAGKLYALVGASTGGTLAADTPASYARVKDLVAALGVGPLVEAAASYIERKGKPVLVVRSGQTTAGACSAISATGAPTGTSVVTENSGTAPFDDYDVVLYVVLGGTIGTGPITLKWSVDGGKTYSANVSLGTAVFLTLGDTGVRLNFAAGTMVTGEYYTARTTAPQWNGTELGTALDALMASAVQWELVHIVGPLDSTFFDTVDAKITGGVTAGKYHAWIGNTRVPTVGESESTYLTSVSGVFASDTSKHGVLCAGATKMTSSITGRKYKRPWAFRYAMEEADASEEVNTADMNRGPLSGVSVRDVNGNADEHDESLSPGLDDARFCVARTVEGLPGVYVNRPRLFSTDGSDFQLLPHRRVMNLAHAALRLFFIRRLNKPILVDKATGFILEEEALEIEAGAIAAMRSVLLAKPKASEVEFTLSRTDNVLSTKTLTGDARVIPLGYPEFIDLAVGFKNPALQVQAA
jgi:hypothetical protein